MMKHRKVHRKACLIDGEWVEGWVIQAFDGFGWHDATRAYGKEEEADEVLAVLAR